MANYRKIWELAQSHGCRLIAMQYPRKDVHELERAFPANSGIIFVGNAGNFGQALAHGRYWDYFIDANYKTWGHCTMKGNRLIAENLLSALRSQGLIR